MKKKVALHNLGCKVNAYETEAMQQMLMEAGYSIVPFDLGADIYIINTCTVTNIADRKSRQMLHKAKRMNPNAVVVATGCYVQAGKETLESDEAIDLVIGNNKKQDLVRILHEYLISGAYGDGVISMDRPVEYENLRLSETGEHTRAYLKVQDGCNQFCSYCIIPYVRGRVRSRSREEILSEVRRLVKNGYQEFVLTGIHLSSYGTDGGDTLLSLIKYVHEIEGVKRIRLGSLEPRIVTEEFAKTLAGLPEICPHFHLSLQSGCDETLKRMNRRYDTGEYREKCEVLRNYFQNPALTTDVIVGFPQETEEEFCQSLDFVKSIRFFETHIFKYSVREGTRAAAMAGQIDEQVKSKRSQQMIALGKEHRRAYIESCFGSRAEVLFEEKTAIGSEEYWTGHTKEYLPVLAKSEKNLANMIVRGEIETLLPTGEILFRM